MLGWWLSKVLCNIVGFMYPAYMSYKAIRTPAPDDDTQWLTYWVIFGMFSFVEFFLDIFLQWVPLYHEAKLVFLIWLAIPTFKGALKLWNDHNDKLEVYVAKLDTYIAKMQASANKDSSAKVAEKAQ
mmetsp:Transcript_31335/g.64937  ORF Transcript_31335/g.64937 Transcript_31335/m.64937 type:complete len:127 (+) Transcript_31335:157-537(+)|eukprot:CAMPEP_0181322680 /NCGR_PEP_ID=MMETSP1101-20121128/19358_1 /TAXON_ID=46948 /ORGANISM="Rhodomonas abbreviata, Strain Caron Lab Isolate" /LENGTH=126 /DNA_ID=CAMNT_0023430611 /DNA_START=150 /DNA_END=530 /DNA_ORIENTATION=+